MQLPGGAGNSDGPRGGDLNVRPAELRFGSSIRAKLVVSFVAIAVFSVAAVSLLGYFFAKDVVEKTVIADLNAISTIQSERVDHIVAENVVSLEEITADVRTGNRLRSFVKTGDHIDRNILTQIVTEMATQLEHADSIDIHNTTGEIVASSTWGVNGRSGYDPSQRSLDFDWGAGDSPRVIIIHNWIC